MPSPQMEEYLEAIARLEERGETVTTSALARECGVAPPTVTEMLQRLAEQGFVHYEPRRGATLSEGGRQQATAILRRHRLWERFLHDVLGIRWDRVHRQACELEHVTSPDLEQRIAAAVGTSRTCPHGHAIPGTAPEAHPLATLPLTALAPDQTARVVSIAGEDASLLRQLAARGLTPGALVRLEQGAPDEAALALSVAGRHHTLEHSLAAHVNVCVVPTEGEARAELSLADLVSGEVGIVREFRAGRGLVARCLALGFTPGVEVRMMQNPGSGPVIVLVRDTRVALGRGEAQKIVVARKE